MRILLALVLFALPLEAQSLISRRYWIVPLDTLAIGHLKHTHVETTGRVKYCRTEDDGDKHVRLVSLTDTTRFIVVEWIPLLPLARCPPAGSVITVRGITRYDPEHLWSELHPVEFWTYTVF